MYHEGFDEPMVEEALYERVKFSSGQKIPLPTAEGEARLFNDISLDQCREALALWPTLRASDPWVTSPRPLARGEVQRSVALRRRSPERSQKSESGTLSKKEGLYSVDLAVD